MFKTEFFKYFFFVEIYLFMTVLLFSFKLNRTVKNDHFRLEYRLSIAIVQFIYDKITNLGELLHKINLRTRIKR